MIISLVQRHWRYATWLLVVIPIISIYLILIVLEHVFTYASERYQAFINWLDWRQA